MPEGQEDISKLALCLDGSFRKEGWVTCALQHCVGKQTSVQ